MTFNPRRIAEYEPQDISGYDHPEEIFFPEVSYPEVAKEEDLEFPVAPKTYDPEDQDDGAD